MNQQYVNFNAAFLSDGSSSVSLELSLASLAIGSFVLSVDPRLAVGAAQINTDQGTVSSSSVSKGVLTINFSSPPTAGHNVTVSGIVLF